MAEGDASPLPFPSPSAILGDSAPSSDPVPALEPVNFKKDTNHARRPSKELKKAAAAPRPTKAPAVEAKDAGGVTPKPKQTKSRNGCITCKTKRLKCGEEKPGCQNCARRKVPCGGYKKVFQWRDYGNPEIKPPVERQKQAISTSPVQRGSAHSSQATTPISEFPPRPPTATATLDNVANVRKAFQIGKIGGDESSRPRQRRVTPPLEKDSSRQDSAFTTPVESLPKPAPAPLLEPKQRGSPEFASVHFDPQSFFAYRPRSISPLPSSSNEPTLTESLLSEQFADHAIAQDFVPFSMPDGVHLPLWSAGAEDPTMAEDGIIDEDIGFLGSLSRIESPPFNWHTSFGTFSPQIHPRSSSSPSGPLQDTLAPWSTLASNLYIQPDFPLGSPEFLMARFDHTTCGILSMMDGTTENPWRTLLWPMALRSSALYHAVLAMTAYHHATDIPALRAIGDENKHLSIVNIKEGIRDHSMTDQTAIATALTLGLSESWDTHTASGNTHIKGAQALVKRALEEHRMNPLRDTELKRLKFLCNAWVYMDVMARLTAVDSDELNDFDSTFFFAPNAPELFMGNGRRRKDGFGINFGMPIDARLDPLMGCAGTLFPLIGRVANLIRKVCRTQSNSPGIVSKARDLKMMLDEWQPPEEVERPEDPTTGVQHAIQTAEAYRWATCLHLHQAVPELPSPSSAELARKVLAALATVPMSSRTTNVHIYPLMVAGCEVCEPEDRQWVQERWQAMEDRKRIGVIDKCIQVTEEVWRRHDAYESQPMTHRKLAKTTDLNPVRRKRGALMRNEPKPSLNIGSPGRLGIIFSYVETDSEPSGSLLKDINGPESARWRKDVADRVTVDPAYSLRGHLHWVGVMWEWGWEVLLG